ncbi:MAG: ParA family protein [Deltaproteobacteria bacterium]|nr:ParA family protein [Deltaproteobacteria bacterium]
MTMVSDFSNRLRAAALRVPVGRALLGEGEGGGMVLAVAAQKGGVGKTTTAVHVAAALAERHERRVLLLDLDAQGHVASSLRAHMRGGADASLSDVLLGKEADLERAVVQTDIPGLSVSAADRMLGQTETALAGKMGRELILRRALAKVRGHYDVVVLDCPPNLGLLTLNALSAADRVLVPCDLSILSLKGVDALRETLHTLDMTFGRAPEVLGLVHTRVDRRNVKQNAAIRAAVEDRYAGWALPVEIGVNTALSGAQLEGRTIFSAAPDARGSADYAALADAVALRLWAS